MQHSSSPPQPPPPQSTQLKDSNSQSIQDMKDLGFEQSATQPPDPEKSNRASSQEAGADALAEPFPGFQHEEVLAKPFNEELRRDMEFQERTFLSFTTFCLYQGPNSSPFWCWVYALQLTILHIQG